jgi:hypothetical protein
MAIIQELLAPSVVDGMVSRIFTPGSVLQRFFGMQIGGPNVGQVMGRAYAWDVFDHVRAIMKARAPSTGPATIAANPVGRVSGTFPRGYEKLLLDYETLNNLRTIGANAGTRDRMGMRYLELQQVEIRQRADNFREFLLAMLLTQGTAGFRFDGDDWIPVSSLGSNLGWTIDWKIPSGNKSSAIPGLNPLGAGNIIDASWATASTNIPGHLDAINQAFQNLVGAPLDLIICDSIVWNGVLNNTKLQAQGGSVNPTFDTYMVVEPMRTKEGKLIKVFQARLKARPWIRWLIVDTGLEIDSVYSPFWNGTLATFMVEPDNWWFAMQEGSEPVKDNPIAPAIDRPGAYTWLREWDEPARVELHSIQNCIPELRIPKAVMQAKVM